MNHTIGFIGGGNMATSLIGGLIENGSVTPQQIKVFDPNAGRTATLKTQFNIGIAENNGDLITACDTLVIAVKPQVLESVLKPFSAQLGAKQPLIISVVAGISAESIETWIGTQCAVIRAMPNTPALVGAGASGLYANKHATEPQRELATQLLNAVGYSAWVNSESDIDSVTALSGSGPAYFMLFIKSLIDAGVNAGLDTQTAKHLAVKTASGAAALIESSDSDLQTLIDNVTSPGGTTEQALKSFNESELSTVVEKAFNAAKNRSKELADELG